MRLIQLLLQNQKTGAQPDKERINIMKHNFEERKQNRIEHAREQAEKNKKKSESLHKLSDEMAAHIPPGQPILVGHHSEKADRRYRQKIRDTYSKGVEASKKAAYYVEKAKTIESNDAIFSDDPNAIEKLDERINELQKKQEFMKAANRFIRKRNKDGFLKLEGTSEQLWEELNKSGRFGGMGYASFELTNNGANIRRLKACRSELQRKASMQTVCETIKGVQFIKNVEANRVQLKFDAIPDAQVREDLFYKYGFRWSRTEFAWQRHLNGNGIFAAKQFLEHYQEP